MVRCRSVVPKAPIGSVVRMNPASNRTLGRMPLSGRSCLRTLRVGHRALGAICEGGAIGPVERVAELQEGSGSRRVWYRATLCGPRNCSDGEGECGKYYRRAIGQGHMNHERLTI